MDINRTPAQASVIDVLDRVLDKGIVIDAWVRLSLAGIDLITIEARIVVASIETYLHHSTALAAAKSAARPAVEVTHHSRTLVQTTGTTETPSLPASLVSPPRQVRRLRIPLR